MIPVSDEWFDEQFRWLEEEQKRLAGLERRDRILSWLFWAFMVVWAVNLWAFWRTFFNP